MARRPQRPCRYLGCRELHRNGNGYCEEHQAEAGAWARQQHKPKKTTERGYGWEWQRKRKRILKRDGGLCQPCEREGRITLAREVDHIVNKASGGDDSDENLQAICRSCHKEKTGRESRIPANDNESHLREFSWHLSRKKNECEKGCG